jgi:hypothetical protein
MGWLLSMLRRLSPQARLVAAAAVGLVTLSILASALTPASHEHHLTIGTPSGTAPSSVTTPAATQQPSPVSAAHLAHAREAAAHFLAGYLPFAYGRASARSVRALTPGLRRQLVREPARLTPVERRRRPRVVSLQVVGEAPGVAFATAMVEDGGIAAYALRLTVQVAAGGWVVSGIDGG